MKVIILAAGQGTRLRPLTNDIPKCMVKLNGKSLIERQLASIKACGVAENDIYILTGYKEEKLHELFQNTKIHFISNPKYETTNMVCTLMCAKELFETESDIVVSYGDIVYTPQVFEKVLRSKEELSVIVDSGWLSYWSKRCEDPLSDAETLMKDEAGYLIEIGQKTQDIQKVQAQYIGLMRYKNEGVKKVLNICKEAERRTQQGKSLWHTDRTYEKMYMTDMLQGLIDEGNKLKAVEIERGWYEVDCESDLRLAESELKVEIC